MEQQTTKSTQQGGFALPQCPHCGKRINPFYAWSIKSKGEFRCDSCGGFSDVKLGRPILWMVLFSVIIAAILLLTFMFMGSVHLAFLPVMLVPFFIFTVLSPFFVRLTPTKLVGQKHSTQQKPPQPSTNQFSLEREKPPQFQPPKKK